MNFNLFRWLGISLASWSLFALLISAFYVGFSVPAANYYGFFGFWSRLSPSFLPYALLTPIFFQRGWQLAYRVQRLWAWVAQTLGLLVVWYAVTTVLALPFELAFWRPDGVTILHVLSQPKLSQVLVASVSFGAINVGALLMANVQDRHKQRIQLAQLRHQLEQSKMQQLRDKLNPHFLFNALNGAISFVRTGRYEAAEEMLLALSEIMDGLLKPDLPLFWSLQEEFSLVERVLEIMRLRFGERLSIETRMEADTNPIEVPSLLMLNLVENILTHGSQIPGQCQVRLACSISDLGLTIQLQNLHESKPENGYQGHGLGLQLTRDRLERAYGEGAWLSADPIPFGFSVTIRVPVRGLA
ncbi:MAG: histidine kinase [Acidobacteria bacterium]|nr:histidine kinase [Acidobacteriota bacterium]